jgi:hypothetical protein
MIAPPAIRWVLEDGDDGIHGNHPEKQSDFEQGNNYVIAPRQRGIIMPRSKSDFRFQLKSIFAFRPKSNEILTEPVGDPVQWEVLAWRSLKYL